MIQTNTHTDFGQSFVDISVSKAHNY